MKVLAEPLPLHGDHFRSWLLACLRVAWLQVVTPVCTHRGMALSLGVTDWPAIGLYVPLVLACSGQCDLTSDIDSLITCAKTVSRWIRIG